MEKLKHFINSKNKALLYVVSGIIGFVVLAGGYAGYIYARTPDHMRSPAYEHYHLRTQIVVDGKPVDFSRDEFQVHDDSSSCSTDISGHPIDFHDNVDQMAHVHWKDMTGGEFLKYFGWNFIGGNDDLLGRRYDQSAVKPHEVKIFGKLLPAIPDDANFYVYVGTSDAYQQKNWNDFLRQDMEEFFGKQSTIGGEQTSVLDWLFPKASAHGEVIDEHEEDKSEEELTRINNLIGNVVVFAQKDEPTDEQIRERFNNLTPLSNSTCGG